MVEVTKQGNLAEFLDSNQSINRSIDQKRKFYRTLTPSCIICEMKIQESPYLHDIFIAEDQNYSSYWFAVHITHYRHEHQKSWDRQHSSSSYQRKIPKYSYDKQKIIYNNRGKRQILRRLIKLPIHHSIQLDLLNGLKQLQYNDDKTIKLINKFEKQIK